MSKDNNEILVDLQRALSYKFVFFIPFDILHNENIRGFLSFVGIKLTQEFVDEYVNSLLILDYDLEIHNLDDDPSLIGDNGDKAVILQGNCSKIAELKDTLGKTSFKNIFNKYTEYIIVLRFACDLLVEFYYKYFSDEIDETYIFRQQKLVLNTHLTDIENTFLKKGKVINADAILQNLQNTLLTLPPVRDKVEFNEVTNEKVDENQSSHSEDNKNEAGNDVLVNNIALYGKKYLRDFIIKGDEVELEKTLNKRFKSSTPRRIRLLIECLAEMHYITLARGDIKKIVAGINNSFENVNSINYDSVKGIKVDIVTNKDYKNIKLEVLECISESQKVSENKTSL